MIHCTMEDLLALKDGQASAWARRHLGECPVCQQGYDGLHQRVAGLRTLANLNPSRDRWPMIRERVLAERRQKRNVRIRWGSLALAASLAGILTVRTFQQRPAAQVATAAPAEDLATLVDRSQQLEETLREYDPRNRVMNMNTAGAVAALEDRIAAVDAELDHPDIPAAHLQNLWRQRVNLMEGLVNVHVAKATYGGM